VPWDSRAGTRRALALPNPSADWMSSDPFRASSNDRHGLLQFEITNRCSTYEQRDHTTSRPPAQRHRRPHADRQDRRSRRPRAQPEERRRRDPPRQAGRADRAVRLREVVSGVRHDLRGGAAALRRVAVGVRATIPRADGEAGRRPDRRTLPGYLDRPEGSQSQPALDRRHRHRDLRPPAAALRADRPPALPELRARDRAAVGPADGGVDPCPAGRVAHSRPRPSDPRPQGRTSGRPRADPQGRLRPRPSQRRDPRSGGDDLTCEVQEAYDRGGRRSAGRAPRVGRGPSRAAHPPDRLARDRAPARQRQRDDSGHRRSGATVLRTLRLPGLRASRSATSSRAHSRSTARTAPARPAQGSGSRWSSTRTSSYPTRT